MRCHAGFRQLLWAENLQNTETERKIEKERKTDKALAECPIRFVSIYSICLFVCAIKMLTVIINLDQLSSGRCILCLELLFNPGKLDKD